MMRPSAQVVLRPGRDKPLRQRHPWVFSGAIWRIEGECDDGDLVRVCDASGGFLATGYLNRRSQIVVRVVSWSPDEHVDGTFWTHLLERAVRGRSGLIQDPDTDAYRLVNAESDGLPGLIVDRYGRWVVMQTLTLGMAQRREELAALVAGVVHGDGLYARDDAEVRLKEGLSLQSELLRGSVPPDLAEITEHGHRFLVDIKRGHKTGFYLDQRENRKKVASYCDGAQVLNVFAYTGGFGVYAAVGGAQSVTNIDSSADALALAEENWKRNGCSPPEMALGDAFQVLRKYRDQQRLFDVVVLDPPKFAMSQAQVLAASRGYKDINLLAMQLLRPGGVLATFSCSGLVSADLFQKIVFGASVDARRDAQVLEYLAQGADHPVLLTFPESAYLKGLICRVW
ncbi:MAG TPA: class I SAM-dependent methyltransferase [Anaerolineae bacterium]|nr:class I SAM-dependent methyltransferase [Anaerolineae bacterium]